MKVKDLMGLNPEAEIVVMDKFWHIFKDELSYSWYTPEDYEEGTDTKPMAKEVCIFIGGTTEQKQGEA